MKKSSITLAEQSSIKRVPSVAAAIRAALSEAKPRGVVFMPAPETGRVYFIDKTGSLQSVPMHHRMDYSTHACQKVADFGHFDCTVALDGPEADPADWGWSADEFKEWFDGTVIDIDAFRASYLV